MNGFPSRNAVVLVVADEVELRQKLRLCLEDDNYRVLEAATGEEGLAKAAESRPDTVLLDLPFPDTNGMAVLRRLREQSRVPILIVSDCDREAQKINALDSGANDYITKPFSAGELMARLRVVLRYMPIEKTQVFRCGRLSVDSTSRTVKAGRKKVRLTPSEYSLLLLLAENAGKVLTYQQILRNIWGQDQIDKMPSLYVCLRHLRQKLELDPSHPVLLITEPRAGIRLAH
jgi:two-component system KDP operon response regulator KdpE